ncbi:hypothetical protein DFP72DRAFT_520944 [Ephemerocybe angulata]|uniref:Uncharacterized protein n=1 Tax=Ephemerocybe angulata TaxID=980116 RepID=A0A8H6ICJ2_9AGAR|nr:hypothetical protein DFP72DRAFT_520944 [Tulosesus angulatus]
MFGQISPLPHFCCVGCVAFGEPSPPPRLACGHRFRSIVIGGKRPHHSLLPAVVRARQHTALYALRYLLLRRTSQTLIHTTTTRSCNCFSQCADRWQRLRLCTTDDFLLQAILDNPMPLLHTLEFSSNSAIGNLNIHPTFAPNLRTVTLLTAPLSLTPLSLPWNQLTQLSSRYWTDVHAHMEVMRRCPEPRKHPRPHPTCTLHSHPCSASAADAPFEDARSGSAERQCNGADTREAFLALLFPNSISVVPEESPEYGVSGWPKALVDSLVERSSCQALKVYLDGIDVSVTGDNFLPVK